jgi:hypothetical protein
MLGTKEKRKKKSSSRPPPNLKEKKSRHFDCMLSLPIGCMNFFTSKTVCHHFWPGLIPPIINWGHLFVLVWKLEISYRVIIFFERFWFLLEDFLKVIFLHGEIF